MIRFSYLENNASPKVSVIEEFPTDVKSKPFTAHDDPSASAVFGSAQEKGKQIELPLSREPERRVVDWDAGDPDNPQNWTRGRRWYITALSSFLVLNATFASSAPAGLLTDIMKHFGLSHEVGVLTISLFVAGYCVGPLLWAPLSEHYGRRPVFIVTFFVYTAFQVGNALSKNTASVLIFRLLGGIFAAGPLTNSGAIVGDIWDPATRGKALVPFTLAPFAGPAIGPVISGYFSVAGVNWRWIFWLLAIFAGACTVLIILTLPETYAPVLLVKKAKRLRQETKDNRYIAPMEMNQLPFGERLKKILLQPFVVLFKEPMLIAITAYMSFVYGCIYLLFEAYPLVYGRDHGLNHGEVGLMFLGLPVGGIIGVGMAVKRFGPRYMAHMKASAPAPPPPEVRLEPAKFGAPLFAAAFFWFGWTSYSSIHWVSPLLSGVLMGWAIFLLFMSLNTYIVDAYRIVAASALAAVTVVRSLTGAAFPLFATQMYEELNPRWASTVVGAVAVVMLPIPFILTKYGARLRKNSKFAPSGGPPGGVQVPVQIAIPLEPMKRAELKGAELNGSEFGMSDRKVSGDIEANPRPLSPIAGSINSIPVSVESRNSRRYSTQSSNVHRISLTLTQPQMAKIAKYAGY